MNPDCDRVPPRPRHEDRLPTLRNGRRWLPWAGCCCLAVAGLALVDVRELAAQRAVRPLDESGALWLSDSPLDDSRRLLLVVDPGSRHAAVYHVATPQLLLLEGPWRNLSEAYMLAAAAWSAVAAEKLTYSNPPSH